MARKFRNFALGVTVASVLPMVSATVLTFDNLPGAGPILFTSNYNGFQFGTNSSSDTAWLYTDEASGFVEPQSGAKFISTDYRLYANDGSYEPTQPILNATPFVFNGAYFSDSPAFETPDRISYQLYLGSELVYTSALSAALVAAPQFVQSGYDGLVTSVVIFGQQGYYGLDDFTYNELPAMAVPEPETYVMMIAGLMGVAAALSRRRSQG